MSTFSLGMSTAGSSATLDRDGWPWGGAQRAEVHNIASDQCVALLEDDEQLATLLTDFLVDEGYAVIRCQSIGEVEDVFRKHPGSVAICDDWSGDYVALSDEHRAEIARLAAGKRLVLTTGRAWAAGQDLGDLGGAVVVEKPFDLETILSAMRP